MTGHYLFSRKDIKTRSPGIVIYVTQDFLPGIVEYDWRDGRVDVKDDTRFLLHARKAWIGESTHSIMLRDQSWKAMSIITRIGNGIATTRAERPKVLFLCRMECYQDDMAAAERVDNFIRHSGIIRHEGYSFRPGLNYRQRTQVTIVKSAYLTNPAMFEKNNPDYMSVFRPYSFAYIIHHTEVWVYEDLL